MSANQAPKEMVKEGSVQMLPDMGVRPSPADRNFEDGLVKELENMLRDHHNRSAGSRDPLYERELDLYRSGSAPPTVEGSRSAIGSLFRGPPGMGHRNGVVVVSGALSDEALQSHPEYPAYYYSREDLNPRLPPPMLSKEDWRVVRRFQAATTSAALGGVGDWRKKELVDDSAGSRSLFSLQPGLAVHRNMSRQPSAEWVERDADGLIGWASGGMGARTKSLVDMLQEGLGRSSPVSVHPSRPVRQNSFADAGSQLGISDAQLRQVYDQLEGADGSNSGATSPGLVRVQSLGSSISHSFAPALGSPFSRSATPDPQLVGRSPSPVLPPVGGRVRMTDKKTIVGTNAFNGLSSSVVDRPDFATTLSGFSLPKNKLVDEDGCHLRSQLLQECSGQPNFLFDMSNGQCRTLPQQFVDRTDSDSLTIPELPYDNSSETNGVVEDVTASKMGSHGQVNLPRRAFSSTNLYTTVPGNLEGSSTNYQNSDILNMDFSGYNSCGYSVGHRLPLTVNDQIDAGSAEGQSLNRSGNLAGSVLQDPMYLQYLQRNADYAAESSVGPSDHSFGRNYIGSSHMDLLVQKAYLGALLAQQKSQYGMPLVGKPGGLNQGYHGNPPFGLNMPYPPSPVSGCASPIGSGSAIRQNERIPRFSGIIRSSTGGTSGPWSSENGHMEEKTGSTLLEEFKNNKTRCFELSEIIDHVVEFSADQYGSRFIQQKLETASAEEKNKIFPEIIPHARALMTDVFGNYVIQKFFEHGTENQRKELANQLSGHVLPLSLQMYGCRVIQKALEVIDVEQQTQMVLELDGAVMKCVRDQNGNHVIQKCIECVPQERIQFIISAFYGQVVALSTHPYGCRVIQRVLEHCDDHKTQEIIMEEILQSVCTLAQDQYGNYVVQHVLQHGKQHERSAIISKLAGQIVKMSQQKFASNVVEKCLTYGGPEERQLLVNEMLGSTDENEPLQVMMKDQFANYVVQKVLETCDDQTRELILSRIKVHLNALKRYTYGKHIVARVEKLIATGEYLQHKASEVFKKGTESI